MKNLLFAFLFLSLFSFSQNGLDSIIVEKYYISTYDDTIANSAGGVLPVGSVTYRFYVDMKPGYKFQAAFGVPTHELRIETSTLFFNNEDRGATTPTYTKIQARANTVMLDSWLSVGAGCAGNYGVLKSNDDSVATVVNSFVPQVLQDTNILTGIPVNFQDGLIAGTPQAVTIVGITTEIAVFDNQNDGTNGPVFSTTNGSWASLNGSIGEDTTLNRVLIAQITTDGTLSYALNIQIGTPTGGVEQYVSKNASGLEILCPTCMDTLYAPNALPSVTITSPVNGFTVSPSTIVPIAVTASDPDGSIDSVSVFIDGLFVGSDLTSPYVVNWNSVSGTHTITAVATDNDGAQNTSSIVTITVTSGGGSGINDNDNNPTIVIYPSPFKDIVNLEITTPKSALNNGYVIYDIKGDVSYSKQYNINNPIIGKYVEMVDLSALAAGQYIIVFTLDNKAYSQKITKY